MGVKDSHPSYTNLSFKTNPFYTIFLLYKYVETRVKKTEGIFAKES